MLNSLAPGRYKFIYKFVNFKHILLIEILNTCCEMNKSALVAVITCAIRQQAITRTDVDQVQSCYVKVQNTKSGMSKFDWKVWTLNVLDLCDDNQIKNLVHGIDITRPNSVKWGDYVE